jgi:hypothetical protein
MTFWLLLCYILVIVLFVLRLFTASDYSFGIFWSLYCSYVVYLRFMITPLVYFCHFIVRTSSIYGLWLLLWYILVILLSVRRLFTTYDYSFGIFWSLYCPYCVSIRLLITSLVYFGHCIVRISSIYGLWLLLWYILVIVLSVFRLFTLLITPLVLFCLFSVFSECFLFVNVLFLSSVNVFYVWTTYFCLQWILPTYECLISVFSECFLRVNVLCLQSLNTEIRRSHVDNIHWRQK